MRGSYEVPLFLTADPEADINSIGVLNDTNSDGIPDQNGVTHPPYTISLPCSALEESGPIPYPVLLGHGGSSSRTWGGGVYFSSGAGTVAGAVSCSCAAGLVTTGFLAFGS